VAIYFEYENTHNNIKKCFAALNDCCFFNTVGTRIKIVSTYCILFFCSFFPRPVNRFRRGGGNNTRKPSRPSRKEILTRLFNYRSRCAQYVRVFFSFPLRQVQSSASPDFELFSL
jgi:hypothetical protein